MSRKPAKTSAAATAFRFVLIMGIVNLFADMTYEGGSSINGHQHRRRRGRIPRLQPARGQRIRQRQDGQILSYTTGSLGKGWVYAVNTALDETGALLGPLLIALVLFLKGSYQTAYALLLISALLTLATLSVTRINFPLPSKLEQGRTAQAKGFTKSYWLYMVRGSLFRRGPDEFRADFVTSFEHRDRHQTLDTAFSRAVHGVRRGRQPDFRQTV